MNQKLKSKLCLIASMATFGTLAPFVRNISVSSGELALYRAVMASVLIGIYLMVTHQKINISKMGRDLPILFLSGAAMGINWILLFEAYKYTTVSVATLSYYFAPVIVTIICPLLFKEKMTKKQIICFVMSTVGLALVVGLTNLGGGSSDTLGIIFGLGAACFYATVIILNKYIKNVSGIHRTLLQFLAAVIVLIPYVTVTSGVNLGSMRTMGWICLFIVGVVHTGICYCLYFSSLKDLTGQQAAILSYIDPLVAVVISVVVLGEVITASQLIGGILILGFTLWNEIGN